MKYEGTNIVPIFLSLSVTCDGPLPFREAAPEVVHHGHQQYELPLEPGQLVPPVMPMRHVLGALQTGCLSLLLLLLSTALQDVTLLC